MRVFASSLRNSRLQRLASSRLRHKIYALLHPSMLYAPSPCWAWGDLCLPGIPPSTCLARFLPPPCGPEMPEAGPTCPKLTAVLLRSGVCRTSQVDCIRFSRQALVLLMCCDIILLGLQIYVPLVWACRGPSRVLAL